MSNDDRSRDLEAHLHRIADESLVNRLRRERDALEDILAPVRELTRLQREREAAGRRAVWWCIGCALVGFAIPVVWWWLAG